MYCRKCLNEIDDDSKFCPNCGEMVKETKPLEEDVYLVDNEGKPKIVQFKKVSLIFAILSVPISLIIYIAIIGLNGFFKFSNYFKYMFIFLIFIPFGIFSLIVGIMLLKNKLKGIANIILGGISITILINILSLYPIKTMYSYKEDYSYSKTFIETITSIDYMPNNGKAYQLNFKTYNESEPVDFLYIHYEFEETLNVFYSNIKGNSNWNNVDDEYYYTYYDLEEHSFDYEGNGVQILFFVYNRNKGNLTVYNLSYDDAELDYIPELPKIPGSDKLNFDLK